MATISNSFETKTSNLSNIDFVCQYCDYKCYKKFNWDRHILTAKHLKSTSRNKIATKNEQNEQNEQNKETYMCHTCNKQYKDRTGLWRHKQKCKLKEECEIEDENYQPNDIHELKEIMKYLMKENLEMKNMMMDVIKTGTHNTTNTNNNTNSHNKTFNLNFYLNETCKDALNITDFVSSIKVSLSDLENTGRQGYIEGISSIILKHLNNLEQYQRPIHCSDVKREVIYIKDNDKWEKECEEKPLLTKAIKVIANENIKKISEWRENNPDCTNSESKKNNLYLKIVSNSMNGSDKEEGQKNITKIISNLAKETIIQKEN
jgi:hypothetical protein